MRSIVARTPGLYLRGVESPPPAGGMTAVTGFVGVSEKGPLHDPQPIRGWGEYLDIFGRMNEYGYLADSVYGFFLNGGEKCYVVRVANHELTAAGGKCVPVEPLLAATNGTTKIVDAHGNETLSVAAINEGRWGNEITVEISYRSEKARLTSKAGVGAMTLRVDTTFDFARHEIVTLTSRASTPAPQSLVISNVSPDTGELTVTGPVGAEFPEGSTISGQQLSRKAITLATLTEDASSTATKITVTNAADFVPGDRLHLVHRDNRFMRREYEVQSADLTTNEITLTDTLKSDFPRDSEVLGRGFRMTIRFRNQREDFEDLSMDPDNPRYFVNVINGDTTTRTTYVDKRDDGHSILIRGSHVLAPTGQFKPTTGVYRLTGGGDGVTFATAALLDNTSVVGLAITALVPGKAGERYSVAVSPFTTTLSLPVSATSPTDQIVVANAQGFTVGDAIDVDGVAAHVTAVDDDHNVITINVTLTADHNLDAQVSVPDRFTLRVRRNDLVDDVEGPYYNLGMTAADLNHFVEERINGISTTICVSAITANPIAPQVVDLAGALEPGAIDARFYTGYDNDRYFAGAAGSDVPVYGLSRLEQEPEINLVSIPDLSRLVDVGGEDQEFSDGAYAAALNQMLFHCRRMGERYALVEPPSNVSIDDAATWPARVASVELAKFGAMYYPWLVYKNLGLLRKVPPSGFVAGMTARSDRQSGVNKVAANLDALGVVDLETVVDADEQGELNLRGLNCLRGFENDGVRLWGGRGLAVSLPDNYVSVRRVILALVKALATNLLWSVFEPNDTSLWKRIESSLDAFMRGMLAKGMVAGATATEAFYVKCDSETNSAESIAAGQVVTEIGIALVSPAEFLVITVKQTADTLEIVETAA